MRNQKIVNLNEAYASIYSTVTEKFENWVDELVNEGYDLSDYTWDDMYEIYINESDVDRLGALDTRYHRPGDPLDPVQKSKALKISPKSTNDKGKMFVRDMPSRPTPVKLQPGRNTSPVPGDMAETLIPSSGNLNNSRIQERPPGRDTTIKEFPPGRDTTIKERPTQREQYDLYDYIMDYLISEGYADTPENAVHIMSSMSEEWKKSILDESRGSDLRAKHGDNPSAKLAQKAGAKAMTYNNRDRLPTGQTGTEARTQNLRTSGYAAARAKGQTPASSAVSPDGQSRTVRSRGGKATGIGAGENRDRPTG